MQVRSFIIPALLLVVIACAITIATGQNNTFAQAATKVRTDSNLKEGSNTGTPTSAASDTTQVAMPYAEAGDNCWLAVQPPTPPNGDTGSLHDIDVISTNDIWAVGGNSKIIHWDGISWNIFQSPGYLNSELSEIEAISDNDIWIATARAATYHWDGSQWTQKSAETSYRLASNNFAAASSNAVFMSYSITCGSNRCVLIRRWNGSNWSDAYSRECNCNPTMHVISPNDVRVGSLYDAYGVGWMMQWNGSNWAEITDDTIRSAGSINSMASTSASDLWLNTFTGIFHWDGAAWSRISSGPLLSEMVAAGPNDVWGFRGRDLYYWDGSTWGRIQNPPNQQDFGGIGVVNPNDIWAVGLSSTPGNYNMGIIHYSPNCVPPTPTNTPEPSATTTPSITPVPPRCTGERFSDVCPGDYFYQHVLDLNDLGIVSGYTTSPPCDASNQIPCFKPYLFTSRGQVAKIISLSAGFNEPVGGPTFQDVPLGHPFYEYIERMASRKIIIGYPCGIDPNEPCDPENRPYFRPSAMLNRAQLSKMTALAFGYQDPPTGQSFEDVVPDNHFYPFIENLASRQIINGYACGSAPDIPCIPPLNRPYFRYGNAITRGQIAKIINSARLQFIATPTPTVAPQATATPTPVRMQ